MDRAIIFGASRGLGAELVRHIAGFGYPVVGFGRKEAPLKELREKFEAVRAEELERNRTKLDERSFVLMDDMTRRMMNRLLHQPTISLKETNGQASEQLTPIEITRKLFGLDKE